LGQAVPYTQTSSVDCSMVSICTTSLPETIRTSEAYGCRILAQG
jgi:hypothetical protein